MTRMLWVALFSKVLILVKPRHFLFDILVHRTNVSNIQLFLQGLTFTLCCKMIATLGGGRQNTVAMDTMALASYSISG